MSWVLSRTSCKLRHDYASNRQAPTTNFIPGINLPQRPPKRKSRWAFYIFRYLTALFRERECNGSKLARQGVPTPPFMIGRARDTTYQRARSIGERSRAHPSPRVFLETARDAQNPREKISSFDRFRKRKKASRLTPPSSHHFSGHSF